MTIEEKAKRAWEDYCYRADGSLYSTVFEDAYKQGATEALASQWVSVEDRLPEEKKNVLVHCSDADPEISDCIAYFKDGVWCFMDEFYYDCTVSHWLPIPPMKGGKDDA